MNEFLLDTDTLSLFLRNQPAVMSKANDYLKVHKGFTFSIITHFEILRGLIVKDARKQIFDFGLICSHSRQINLTSEIIACASEIYANLYKRGELIGDADILIAATALENNLSVVTNNESHFNRILGLHILNWNK